MDHVAIRRIMSRLWGPVCAVTAAHGGEAGGQIVVGVLSASILPEHPRLLIQVWKANRTHDLIAASRAFAVHPLAAEHTAIVRQLGFRSGHDGMEKLDGLDWSPGISGSPILTAPPGFVECRVVGTLDATDMTVFLGAVIAGDWRGGETPPVQAYTMIAAMPAAWQEEYRQHDRAQREAAARLLDAATDGPAA